MGGSAHQNMVVDCVAGRIAQRPRLAVLAEDHRVAVHPHEPLRRGQEDHRLVAAPAVRVLMLELRRVPEASGGCQRMLDDRVCFEDLEPAHDTHVGQEAAVAQRREIAEMKAVSPINPMTSARAVVLSTPSTMPRIFT